MQTFLSFYSTAKSLYALDRVRANKQRPEAIHVLETLLGEREGYKHHPIMAMWRGYEPWLATYAMMACHVYSMRRLRFGETHAERYDYMAHITRIIDEHSLTEMLRWRRRPPWRHDTDLLTSHRSNLIRKDPVRYGELFGDYPDNYPYLWPESDPDDKDGYILRVSRADRERLAKGERVLPEHLTIDMEDGIIL